MPILPDPDRVVLDTSALLAYLSDDAGADTVEIVLNAAARGLLSVVSPTLCLGEALSVAAPTLGQDGIDDFRAAIEQLPVEPLPLDLPAALDTAIGALAWRLGYPEASAAAASQSPRAILLTANPQFAWFERAGGRVYWIGPEERRNELTLFDPLARFRSLG